MLKFVKRKHLPHLDVTGIDIGHYYLHVPGKVSCECLLCNVDHE